MAQTPDQPFAAAALTDVLATLAPKVRATVRAVLGATHPDADDATQQALIAVARALPAYRGEGEVAGYARVIATRVAIASRKRGRVARSRRDDDAETDALAAHGPSPSETVASAQRMALLRSLLDELPEPQAEALALRVVVGLSLEEVAAHTGVPVNTVRSRVRLAKERLRERIESDPRLEAAFGTRADGEG